MNFQRNNDFHRSGRACRRTRQKRLMLNGPLLLLLGMVTALAPADQLSRNSLPFVGMVESLSQVPLETQRQSSIRLTLATSTTKLQLQMPTKDNSSNSIHCDETTRGKTEKGSDKEDADPSLPLIHRRTALFNMAAAVVAASAGSATIPPLPSHAYTPDPDKLQESLYFVSRVQEATVQQERYIRKNLGGTGNGKEVRAKLKLTLRLVDKNYKLLDQINYASAYVTPPDQLVEASAAGYEAVDALQGAIDFVANDSNWAGGNDTDRAEVLTGFLRDCREQLLVFTESMPAEKLRNARYRVEDENVKNRDEFDGDEDAGVYNPVNLPWKPVLAPTKPR